MALGRPSSIAAAVALTASVWAGGEFVAHAEGHEVQAGDIDECPENLGSAPPESILRERLTLRLSTSLAVSSERVHVLTYKDMAPSGSEFVEFRINKVDIDPLEPNGPAQSFYFRELPDRQLLFARNFQNLAKEPVGFSDTVLSAAQVKELLAPPEKG